MQIIIRGEHNFPLDVQEDKTIGQIKSSLSCLKTEEADKIVLSYGGCALCDEDIVGQTLIPGSHVDLDVLLLGGKVHGSLARAGKVKGQTPKVEKLEKKKKKLGRAKRREAYNRRFVNAVVNTFGKKRGPNSNQK